MKRDWSVLLYHAGGRVALRAGGMAYNRYSYGTRIRVWSTSALISGTIIVKPPNDQQYATASKDTITGIFHDVLWEYYFDQYGRGETIYFTEEMFNGMMDHVVDIIQYHPDLGVLMSGVQNGEA